MNKKNVRNKKNIDGFQFAKTILNSISAHVAILDENGIILETNKAWKSFAEENNLNIRPEAVQVNYLDICDSAGEDKEANQVAHGIRQVIAGKLNEFVLDYPCHSPEEKRWFSMRVTRAIGNGPVRVVVSHENVTRLKEAEEKSRLQAEALQLEKKKLEEAFTALKVLLNQRQDDQKEMETLILDNVRRQVNPVIEQLMQQAHSDEMQALLHSLRLRLMELTKPFLKRLSAIEEVVLTPQEVEIAALIREGRSSQEIADRLRVSITTVHFHRRNLRRKLGLNHSGTNLRSFLLSLIN